MSHILKTMMFIMSRDNYIVKMIKINCPDIDIKATLSLGLRSKT